MEVGSDYNGLCHETTETSSGYDTIWVIVDRLTKFARFLPMKETDCDNRQVRTETTNKIAQIQQILQATCGRQKSYADKRRKPLEFQVGDRVMLKVPPWKGVIRFGAKGKLAPRYVVPFEITQRTGPVAYKLRLPDELNGVHDVFHVSNLKRCLADESLVIPLEEIQVYEQLYFMEERVEIMDRDVKRLKRSHIPVVKVRWNSKSGPEFTWEREDHMKTKYPHLFEEVVPDNYA
ncbi:hypothetical protein E3N88_13760 [Mikania micrantha]|uniref:Tf2-1-like SH3-like domain-containing protein n=1 Tax=Mikania micrantha TaxID=192012 RepID=A0A5N6NZE3_9ASTR|nr:hypothetical protein E3N88_13760 [Mikania micrantha]